MDPLDDPKTTFMLNHGNYYNDMPFSCKNPDTTYQRLMDVVFAHQTGQNLKVYVDDMIVKTVEGRNHVNDLEDVIHSVREYDTCLNPTKCYLGFGLGNS